MADRTRPLKLETPAESGSSTDLYPTEVNPNQDGVDCNALFLQSTSSVDSTVYVNRSTAGAMTFVDPLAGTKALNRLVSNALTDNQSHQALIDIIHFLSDGPGDGWATGAYCVDSYSGLLLVSSIWYTSSNMQTPIVAQYLTYNGLLVATEKLVLYSAGTAVRTVVDTWTNSGVFRTARTRAWS